MLGRRVFNDGNGGSDPKADEFKSMVVEMMVLAGVFNIGDFIPALEWLDIQGVQEETDDDGNKLTDVEIKALLLYKLLVINKH
ncbi:hypothetical protein TSUD_122240 [Trifolium subterraneum]|nr:hypothetical protein TSUD_122240 [Trifolium subterraneum]